MLPLYHLFTVSFKSGYIPECLKTAMVKLILKRGPEWTLRAILMDYNRDITFDTCFNQ